MYQITWIRLKWNWFSSQYLPDTQYKYIYKWNIGLVLILDSGFRNDQMDNINVCLFETWIDP